MPSGLCRMGALYGLCVCLSGNSEGCDAVSCVHPCCDTGFIGHIHRQNRLEEHGVKIAVQKLEKMENTALKNV